MVLKKEAHIHYFNMGPWPCYVGFTTDEKLFSKEMKRLGVKDIEFLGHPNAQGTTHFLSNNGTLCFIITMIPYTRRVTKECYSALVAHEALHVVQDLQKELAKGKSLGDEAEAYLLQYIVQEVLQVAFGSSKVRNTIPV